MKKKRLISLMLAGVMLAGTMSLAGCATSDEVSKTNRYVEELIEKNMIVALYEKNITLHRADIYNCEETGYNHSSHITNKLDFKCDKSDVKTPMYINYGDNMPERDCYDEICQECFPEYASKTE